jgi:hypothetical protein
VNTLTNNGYNGVNTLNNQLQQQAAGYNTGGTAVTINTATGTRYLDLCIEWWNVGVHLHIYLLVFLR